MSLIPTDDIQLRRALGEWPSVGRTPDPATLLRRAEYHGLGGVIADALESGGLVIDERVRFREAAREVDHAAHLGILRKLDEACVDGGLDAVVLKGALFAERFYPRPAARVTGDIDLLVREVDLELARRVLLSIGYVPVEGAVEERFRREHFHLHYRHANAIPVELHFHAYRGFGGVLRSEELLERSVAVRDFRALHVLDESDELVYLAVHAAAHKFGRWSWLFDLRLLIETLSPETLVLARERAHQQGFARPLALAGSMLVSIMGMPPTRVRALGELGALRAACLVRLLRTPRFRALGSASRLAYTTTLCPDARSSVKWLGRELMRRWRSIQLDA